MEEALGFVVIRWDELQLPHVNGKVHFAKAEAMRESRELIYNQGYLPNVDLSLGKVVLL
jgi:hypothetical protein